MPDSPSAQTPFERRVAAWVMVVLSLMVLFPTLLYVYAINARNGSSWEDAINGTARVAIGGLAFFAARYWRWGYLRVLAVGTVLGALTGVIAGAAALVLAPAPSFGLMYPMAGYALLGGCAALIGAVGQANLQRVLDRLGGRA